MKALNQVFINNDLYRIDIEKIDDSVFIHMKVNEWSPDVAKLLKLDWEILRGDAYMEGYDHLFSYTKNSKFAKLIDNTCTTVGVVEDPVTHEVYDVLAWELSEGDVIKWA